MKSHLLKRLNPQAAFQRWFDRQMEVGNWRGMWKFSQYAFLSVILASGLLLWHRPATNPVVHGIQLLTIGICVGCCLMNLLNYALQLVLAFTRERLSEQRSVNQVYVQQIMRLQGELHEAQCGDVDDHKEDRSSPVEQPQETAMVNGTESVLTEILQLLDLAQKETKQVGVSIAMKMLLERLVQERLARIVNILGHEGLEPDTLTASALFHASLAIMVKTGLSLEAAKSQLEAIYAAETVTQKGDETTLETLRAEIRKELIKRKVAKAVTDLEATPAPEPPQEDTQAPPPEPG